VFFHLNLITKLLNTFVSENDGMIGVIGVNWLTQPLPDMQKYVDNVASLSVKGFKRMDIISHHKII
jgi:hypothetical protein